MLKEFDELVTARAELITWWDQYQKAKADHENTQVFIRFNSDRCFDAYHRTVFLDGKTVSDSAPSGSLEQTIREGVRSRSEEIITEAYQKQLAAMNARIAELRNEVLAVLNSV